MKNWKTIASDIVYKSKFITIKNEKCERDDGHIIPAYLTIETQDSAGILALTPDLKVVMTKQYRHAIKQIVLEPTAGYHDPSDKDLSQTASRELLEESGYKAEKIIKLGYSYPSAGISNTSTHIFLGLNCEKVDKQHLDGNEQIDIQLIPWRDVLKMLENGEIKSTWAQLAIHMTNQYLQENKLI